MGIELKIRNNKDGKQRDVVKFYDPNVTNSHVRMACDPLEKFKAKTLEQFMDTKLYQASYPEDKEGGALSLMLVYTDEEEKRSGFPARRCKTPRKTGS